MNDSATITDTYQLDAWGHQIASSGSTQNPYKYACPPAVWRGGRVGVSAVAKAMADRHYRSQRG